MYALQYPEVGSVLLALLALALRWKEARDKYVRIRGEVAGYTYIYINVPVLNSVYMYISHSIYVKGIVICDHLLVGSWPTNDELSYYTLLSLTPSTTSLYLFPNPLPLPTQYS